VEQLAASDVPGRAGGLELVPVALIEIVLTAVFPPVLSE
jgi:hypothetical protein